VQGSRRKEEFIGLSYQLSAGRDLVGGYNLW